MTSNWSHFKKRFFHFPDLRMSLDISRMDFPDDFIDSMRGAAEGAFDNMRRLEQGAIANPDENRMVGHYWLRNSRLAPSSDLAEEIEGTIERILRFSTDIRTGGIRTAKGVPFSRFLLIGIGGSALGPQLVADAVGDPAALRAHFFDNTDPDGFDRVLGEIGEHIHTTLCLVISKSGGTKETRNGMIEARRAFEEAGVPFAAHAVAVTGAGSELDRLAAAEGWLSRFPMWDWVGGRTSVTSAVGLLPAALQGVDIKLLLEGAGLCDETTRIADPARNPAMLLALMWHHATGGRGAKDMVVLPYKDRLLLFSRYLQQLVMESLGKERDLDGRIVCQGLSVYGNKGSTDQHAYVQQLRDGVDNFFVTFISVLKGRSGTSIEVEEDVTSADYLHGFFLGTRDALSEKGRQSITLTFEQIDAHSLGALIALYERAVGFYAFLIHINAYHQPGVEAGKKAAGDVLHLQRDILQLLRGKRFVGTAEEIAAAVGADDKTETVFQVLEHLRVNRPDMSAVGGENFAERKYGFGQ